MSPSIYSIPTYNVQQIIPLEMMEDLAEGDKNVILRKNGCLFVKELEEITNNDQKFAINPREAWKRLKKGEAVETDFEDFHREL
jgi:hypothetical protein